jgi:hypothetical protein
LKQTFRVGNAVTGIADSHHDPLTFHARADSELLPLLVLHGTLAVLGEVQEHLQKIVTLRPDPG